MISFYMVCSHMTTKHLPNHILYNLALFNLNGPPPISCLHCINQYITAKLHFTIVVDDMMLTFFPRDRCDKIRYEEHFHTAVNLDKSIRFEGA